MNPHITLVNFHVGIFSLSLLWLVCLNGNFYPKIVYTDTGHSTTKKTRQWTAVPILKPKTYEYIPELMELICAKSRNVQGPIDQPLGLAPTDPRNIAPSRFATPRPDMQELLKSHKFRFK